MSETPSINPAPMHKDLIVQYIRDWAKRDGHEPGFGLWAVAETVEKYLQAAPSEPQEDRCGGVDVCPGGFFENDAGCCPGWCASCGVHFSWVRPGKSQPNCDCDSKAASEPQEEKS